MTDYHQEGIITTLHQLFEVFDEEDYLLGLEQKLETYSRHHKICLLLPSLYAEVQVPEVLNGIRAEINKADYLHQVVIALGSKVTEEEFLNARNYFGKLGNPERDVRVVWVLGPRVQQVLEHVRERQIPTGEHGKGQSVWVALGYIFGRGDSDVIALHDCDIVTYHRILLARLIEPVANPNNDFEFCKGYYARVSPTEKSMKGRVTRLFVIPFLDAMIEMMREREIQSLVDFFQYHKTFKYPLAGEFSLTTQLAKGINIASDWGLEVSTLSEVYNRIMPRKIAQIDLALNYEHKHQNLSPEDTQQGLHRMVIDIANFYFNYLRSHGIALDAPFMDAIRQTYFQNALRFIKIYSDDAEVNNLLFDRYQEEITARCFRDFLQTAWQERRADPGESLIPSWNRVLYSCPEIYEALVEAVEEDNA